MPTPITTFQDILNALERDPSLKRQLRQHILTEELLNPPALIGLSRVNYSCRFALPHNKCYSTEVVASPKMLPKSGEATSWGEA